MIPLRDLNPTTIRPLAVYWLIGINVVAFLLSVGNLDVVVTELGAKPFHFTFMEPDWPPGGYRPSIFERFPPPPERHWWFPITALTSAFLHGGWLHILGNMWFLWVFADNIEEHFGRVRFLVFYFVSALGAVAAQVISDPDSAVPMVGASGAVSGVLGAYLRLFPRARVVGLVPLGFLLIHVVWPAGVFIGLWVALQSFSALASLGMHSGTAWFAHLGGFAVGWVLAKALDRGPGPGGGRGPRDWFDGGGSTGRGWPPTRGGRRITWEIGRR